MEFRRLAAQLLHFRGGRFRFEQGVIDEARHFPGTTAIGVQAEPRCAGEEHATHLARTAIEAEAMAAASRRRDGAGGGQLLENDVDDAADIGHGALPGSYRVRSSVRIFASRRI